MREQVLGGADPSLNLLLELFCLEQFIEVFGRQSAGLVSPTRFRWDHLGQGFLLLFMESKQFLLDLGLCGIESKLQSRAADNAQLHLMAAAGLFADGDVIEIVGAGLQNQHVAFAKAQLAQRPPACALEPRRPQA